MASSPKSDEKIWSVYFIQTSLNTLYAGVTTNVERRFLEHVKGGVKSAKYLRGKGSLTLVWHAQVGEKKLAMQVEYALKQLPKAKKLALVKNKLQLADLFPNLFDSVN